MSEESEVEYSGRLRSQEQGMYPEHDNSEPTLDGLSSPAATASLAARYDILGELGHGGMGIVYKARDRETGEVVALKVLKPEIATHPEVIERFKAELCLARKITHKSVCRTYELLRFEGTIVITMEYVEGESLRAFLTRYGSAPLRKGLEWAAQICGALSEAHAQSIIHRDLKPENILIDRQGNAKVMDFGIARSIATEASLQGAPGMVMGTPAYMSPEQAEGKPVDARSDIYSVGLIFYEMFAGKRAFQADTPADYIHKQVHDTPALPREIEPLLPGFLDRAIQRCLEKKPEKRFQFVSELEAALKQEGETVLAASGEEIELPDNLTRWQRSDWLLVVAAIIGLALFFPFFNRTSIAPRSKVTFDRGALCRICEEYAQRLGAPVTGSPSMQLWWFGQQYDYVTKHSGAQAALELTNNPVPYWVWVMDWPNGTEVAVDHHGSLVSITREFPATPAIERRPAEAAKELAEKGLREFFGRDPSLLTLEMTSEMIRRGQPATWFMWSEPRDYRGLKHRYTIWVVGTQTATLAQGYGHPGPEVNLLNEEGWQILPGGVLGLAVLILGISQRRHVELGARWHFAFIALGSFMGLYIGQLVAYEIGGAGQILVAGLAGVATAFAGFFVLVALERAVRRVWPGKLVSLARLFDRRAFSEPCGLAILRGTFLGLALLGLDFFLVWLGTSHLGMRLDSLVLVNDPPRSAQIGTGWSTAFVTIKEFYQAGSVAFIVSFLASFLVRLIQRRWLALAVAAVLTASSMFWPMLNMGAVQPYSGKVAILFLECLLLTFAFSRFDVLTILWAAFTFAFCWANYYLLVMFEPTGAFEQWAAFVIFGLIVIAAAGTAFQSALRSGYRRAKLAFE